MSPLQAVTQLENDITDPLHELLLKGPRGLIAKAVELELTTFLEKYADNALEVGRLDLIRNNQLPKRTIQIGIGDVSVQVPKECGGSGRDDCFNRPT